MTAQTFDYLFVMILILILMMAGRSESAQVENWGLRSIDSTKIVSKQKILVAIIDTGIDVQHPALKNQLWVNPGESGRDAKGRDRATNGVDDDNNGFVDDVHGWNFVDDSADLADHHGHGTHIAGIIGGQDPRGVMRIGVSSQAQLMILKYYDPQGRPTLHLRNTVAAIRYAVKMGARIINYSSGGQERSFQEEMAIREAAAKNILFITASGNDGSNLDQKPYYPAKYSLNNMISVTAYDLDRKLLKTSNFGKETVDIAAPGQNIVSTLPGGLYGPMTGTSQATAFVTGVAANLLSTQIGSVDPAIVVRHLVFSGDTDERLRQQTRFETRLNANRAISQAGSNQLLSGQFDSRGAQPKKEDWF